MSSNHTLSREELVRYARHAVLPEVGTLGQEKLKASSVLVIGTGGLGSPVCLYLAAAGVGRIGVVDFDHVDESNLQRQVIHHTSDIGRPKVDSAKERIAAINPFVDVQTFNERISSQNGFALVEGYDLVIDGTDNFATRYLVNDLCVLAGKPNCYGSIFRFEGQSSVLCHSDGPCYRCLYPQPPDPGLIPNCAEGGVLGVLPGMVGTIQANEAIKLLLGIGEPLIGRMLLIDALDMQFRQLTINRDPHCPVCGPNPTITSLIDYDQFCTNSPQGHSPNRGHSTEQPSNRGQSPDQGQSPWDIEPQELKRRLDVGESVTIVDVREPFEYEICNLGGRLIPLAELPNRLDELNREEPIVVHCKMGGRSTKATRLLRDAGFTTVENLRGGIKAWRSVIDNSLADY
ncbi:molybdopterin-synthase adenylyltransferase MoeB [Stieleria sp. JC731]|uniref:molybdopterin-synthase adenylyltransferase MoeB n=1 Tax=Pirellulaceae TaxID=2691357 RepID=UPI001E580947|nr:molybdopterin-synthase adenylyltransferase MoeB [Stieleria sp. JC731]MCC9600514.1 molybdopterin-synthase adenylyltransferase MoeB [Stieleria sp. JC731]